MSAKTMHGMEDLLVEELKLIGAKEIGQGKRIVHFKGDLLLLYKANLMLRTAVKILIPLSSKKITNEKELYRWVYDYPWENIFDVSNTLLVESAVSSLHFPHSQYVSLKTKDAIVDRFRDKYKRRPDVNLIKPDFIINIHISEQVAHLSLNGSGVSLHKRGYKIRQGEAPLNEILAAALVLSSNYDCKTTFLDPMCGSGTLITEAMMIAAHCPPQFMRKHFAFMNWSGYHAKSWNAVYEDAMKQCVDIESDFFACDIDPEALSATRQNVENLGIKHSLNLRKRSFFDTESAPSNTGILISNPPYGERMKLENMIQFYKNMGDVLKGKFKNWDAWIFSGNLNALKHLGLKTSKKISFYNGAILSKLQKYPVY